jgi:hypothetical protein
LFGFFDFVPVLSPAQKEFYFFLPLPLPRDYFEGIRPTLPLSYTSYQALFGRAVGSSAQVLESLDPESAVSAHLYPVR